MPQRLRQLGVGWLRPVGRGARRVFLLQSVADEVPQIGAQPVAELLRRLVFGEAALQRSVRIAEALEELLHQLVLREPILVRRIVEVDDDLGPSAVHQDVWRRPALIASSYSHSVPERYGSPFGFRNVAGSGVPIRDHRMTITASHWDGLTSPRSTASWGVRVAGHRDRRVRVVPPHRLAGDLSAEQRILRQLLLDHLLGEGALVGDISGRRNEDTEMHSCGNTMTCRS